MRFHLALPELNGLGVITWTPGLMRSAHVLMCFGFPWRTMNDTIESVTMPLVGPLSQLGETSPAVTSFCMSGSREKFTTSAGRPSVTEVACVPDGPKDWENVTPWPADVSPNAAMSAA